MLSQNFNPVGLTGSVLRDFVKYAESRSYSLKDEYSINMAWGEFQNLLVGSNNPLARGVIVGPYSSNQKLYDSGPFSYKDEDLISDVTTAGSMLMQWLPTSTTNVQNEVVSHISWVAPAGWSGSSYSTFLNGIDIADCEYGPSTKWDATQYEISYGEFSWTTDTFKINPTLTMRDEYANSPKFRLRGPYSGTPLDISNDVDFNVARVAIAAQNHLSFVLLDGEKANNPKMEWDGISQIIVSGYVTAHRTAEFASKTPVYSDPVTVDGSVLATVNAVISEMRHMIRFIRMRASKRRLSIMPGDMAIFMGWTHWHRIAEALAVNGMLEGTFYQGPDNAESRLSALMTTDGGLFPVDGVAVPVYCDDGFAVNSNSNTTSTGDIYILTRRLAGETILEQQYIDFNEVKAKWPVNHSGGIETTTGLGGIARYGWISENIKCFYYFMEMGGRVVSRCQPYQGRISSVTLPLSGEYREEALGWYDDFYANNGTPGSLGSGIV